MSLPLFPPKLVAEVLSLWALMRLNFCVPLSRCKERAFTFKTTLANQDHLQRWRAFLTRWNGEFPDLGEQSKKSLPILERTYARMIQELLEKLADEEIVDNDFAMQDLLERYGVRLSQLGTLINLVTPLADATPNQESPPHS